MDAAASPVHSYGSFKLRVPHDSAPMHDLVREAHSIASQGRESGLQYEALMRTELARLLQEKPIFWSRLWPAGFALGRFLLAQPGALRGCDVLSLGCGLGPEVICAALAGARRVLATDIEGKALKFVAQSARDNAVSDRVSTCVYDWNQPPPPPARGPFDLVLAGDVIYQDTHAPRLGKILGALVKPGGSVIFSDSLERPYKEGHQSELCALLTKDRFQQRACHDVDVSADMPRGTAGVAGGKMVRLLQYSRARGGAGRAAAG